MSLGKIIMTGIVSISGADTNSLETKNSDANKISFKTEQIDEQPKKIYSDTLDVTKELVEETNTSKVNIGFTNKTATGERFWALPFVNNIVSLQELNASYGDFTAAISTNHDLKQREIYGVNTSIGAFKQLNNLVSIFGGGVNIAYRTPERWGNAGVLYLGGAFDVPLNPSITAQTLIGYGGGQYIEASISESQKIPVIGKTVDLTAKLGLNRNALIKGTKMTHAEFGASKNISLGKNFDLTPSISYFQPITNDVEKGIIGTININYKLK